MNAEEFVNVYWRYYLILEEHFENIMRFVELDEDNYSTFSLEMVKQIQSTCSEVEMVMKKMCGFTSDDRKTITDYATVLLNVYPDISAWEVKSGKIIEKPFGEWQATCADQSLSWWNAYNKVKHGREGNFREANLKNALKSLMGLFLLEMLHYKKLTDNESKQDIIPFSSKLFSIVGWSTRYIAMQDLIGKFDGENFHLNNREESL